MITKTLSSYIANLQYEQLPPAVVDMAKVAVMDWLGSVLAGSRQKPAQIAAGMVKKEGGNPQATLIGFDAKFSVSQAALVNGVSSHILEMDDLHRDSILHPAAPIISAAAAMAENERSTGKDFITAVVAGYETGIRIAEAITPSHYYYWHTTGTCGTFGAAAAAAKIYSLNEEATQNALGSAGTQAAGLWEFLQDGAMSKHLHPGKAAMNGVQSVLLAWEGFTGAQKILEGKKGFFKATASEIDESKAIKDLGEDYRILGNSYKIYPSCRHTHGIVDLGIEMVKEGVKAFDIAKIKVKTYSIARDIVGNPDPKTSFEAKFSLPYCLARALVDGDLVLESFDPAVINDPKVWELISICSLDDDYHMDNLYPAKWPSYLEITLKNGQVLRKETSYPKGDPEKPATRDELELKFKKLASMAMDEIRAESIINNLGDLESMDSINKILV